METTCLYIDTIVQLHHYTSGRGSLARGSSYLRVPGINNFEKLTKGKKTKTKKHFEAKISNYCSVCSYHAKGLDSFGATFVFRMKLNCLNDKMITKGI